MIGSHPLLHHHRGKADENSNTSLEHHRHADSISPVSSMDSNPHAEEERGGSLPKSKLAFNSLERERVDRRELETVVKVLFFRRR